MKTKRLSSAKKMRKITIEHRNIVRISTTPSKSNLEWKSEGDYFKKFSLYNNALISIQRTESLGSTTLI
jgi:hypothetical protein